MPAVSDAAPPIAEVVDLDGLWKTAVAALVGGVGLTAAFSVAVFGAVRFQELRQVRPGWAAAYAALGVAAFVVVLAGIAIGLAIMLEKRPEL
jgi:hypothetical protein